MSIFCKRSIAILALIISVFIYIFISLNIIFFQKSLSSKKEINSTLVLKISKINPITKSSIYNEEENEKNLEDTDIYTSNNWRILIPKISLDAPILEGTTNENMRRGVAHFENSAMWDGNVCLAAHNRGYKYNYFQDIHLLEQGDIIMYKTTYGLKKYKVEENVKIKETDWSYLKSTQENKITLITCVKNMPEYRICIQAKEI